MTYRIFTNDVGPNAYSCLTSVRAESVERALVDAIEDGGAVLGPSVKFLAILDAAGPLDEFGPDGRTGRLPIPAVMSRGRAAGVVAGPRVG